MFRRWVVLLVLLAGGLGAWAESRGVVMAGSWEPLLFRVRRDGAAGYEPTAAQRAEYEREQSPAMVAELKALGVNFVMMHCYKGAGLEAERESMADAVRFSKLCHDAGLRVGVYNFSGAFLWELFFKERPDARDWVLRDAEGKERAYGKALYRYYWNRNHPAAQEFYHGLVKFAVEDIRADLLHFDNFEQGPGTDANSVERFREYLRDKFGPERLAALGVADAGAVMPAMSGPVDNFLRRAWLDFQAQSLADAYRDLSDYGRSLRPDILIECNPGGVGDRIDPLLDHGRLLDAGEAFWDESRRVGFGEGRLATRIRTYKVARSMNNMAFTYTTSPLEMAESMAFNLDCLGCIGWFEYGHVVKAPGVREPLDPATADFVKFFNARRDLYSDTQLVADAAVLRSYPSHAFGGAEPGALTARVEQTLIEQPTAFEIIHEHQLGDLSKYRVLVLAGCVALSDEHVKKIREYVTEEAGRLLLVGEAATHNEWMEPRPAPAFQDLADGHHVVKVEPDADVVEALRRIHPLNPTLAVSCAPMPGVCAEVTRKPHRWMVHLVNYRPEPAKDVRIELETLACHPEKVWLASPEHAGEIELPFEKGERVSFVVPQVQTYEVAVVETSEVIVN